MKKINEAVKTKGEEAVTYTKDGTYMQLPDGRVNFNIDFDWNDKKPAPQGYSLKGAELKFNTRQKYRDTTILTPEDIRLVYNEGMVTNADGMIVPNERKDIIGAIGIWQQLVRDMNPNMETLKKPDDGDPAKVEAYNIKRAERWINHIKPILTQWKNGDANDFGRNWYSEKAEDFAKRVGRDVKDVNNDVVKAWLFLTTAATSPNTAVEVNAKFAANAIASLVRFYETGKLHVPKFQYHNDGTLILKDDGTPKKLGLGSIQMEKVEMLTKGYVPAESVEGWTLFSNDAPVVKSNQVLETPINSKNRYVYSETAANMMEKYGGLQGVLNYLLSPSLDGKKFNKAVDIFGDKVGAFLSNLIGLTQIPTIDTWMNRYFMGLTGDAIEVKRAKNGKVTKVIDKSGQFQESEGDFMRAAIQKATEDWNKENNETLTPADTQAIIWTQVKGLFNDLTKMESDNIDFATAYDQIKSRMGTQNTLFPEDAPRNKELPAAESNPALLADAAKQAPMVKQLTSGELGAEYGQRWFIEKRDDMSLAIKSEEGKAAKDKEIDMSDEKLKNADFDSWVNTASRLIGNGALSDGELEKMKQISATGDGQKMMEFVSGLNKISIPEIIASFFRVNPLVGVKNLARNTISNELHQIANEVAKVPAFMADLALTATNKAIGGENTEKSIMFPSLISNSKAIWEGLTTGMAEAGRVLTSGSDTVNFEQPALFRERTTGHLLLKPIEAYIKYGFRLQEAADRPFKTQAAFRALDEIKTIRAKELDISKDEVEPHLTVEDIDKAVDMALYLTFQDSNSIAKQYYQMRDGKSPVVRALMDFTVPYVKTPLNVVGVMLDYSGLYPALKGANKLFGHGEWKDTKEKIKNILDTPEDRQAISFAIGKGMVGWTTTYIGFKMGVAGVLSSFFEKDDRKEKDEQAAKGTGYGKMNIGGYSVDIASLTPVSFYLLAGAAYAEAISDHTKKVEAAKGDAEKLKKLEGSSPLVTSIFRTLNNLAIQTPILGTILRVANDNQNRQKGGSVDLTSIIGANRIVPAVVGEVAKTMDSKERVMDYSSDTSKIVDTVKSMIPKVRETLPVKYDMLGREIEAPYGFDPLKTTKIKKDDLVKELDRFDITITDNTEGTAQQKNEARGKKGREMEPILTDAITSSQYQEADDKTKKSILMKTISAVNRENSAEAKSQGEHRTPDEEKHNLTVMRERELFFQKLNDNPNQFSRDREITDKKMLANAKNAGIDKLNYNDILAMKDFDKFVKKNFLYNLTVTDDMSKDEAERNLKEFQKDPEGSLVKWYLSQKAYEERTKRLTARKAELTKEGKTEAEIQKILSSDSAKLGWKNRRNPLTKLVMKKDRFRESLINQYPQSDNIEDLR
jgi:hypothetical protein